MGSRSLTWLQWTAFGVGVVACLAIAFGAYTLAGYSWAQVIGYKSPYVTTPPSAGLVSVEPTPDPALVRTVVLVIVDGLREDVSRTSMPTLTTLRTYGSDISLTVPQPSLSFPNWTTILTGAPPTISGVTTNWYTGRVIPPTLIETAEAAGERVVVVGPQDFQELYGVTPGPGVSLRKWPKGGYLSGQLVDDALRLSKEATPGLVVLHLPDVDEAGHSYGGGSAQYREVASKVDADIARLVQGMQSDGTTFVVVADHGHIDSGGHGGWEPVVLHVPGVFSGPAVRLGSGSGGLEQVAPTVSVLLGLRDPAYASGQALRSVIATEAPTLFASDVAHHIAFDGNYVQTVTGSTPSMAQLLSGGGPDAAALAARDARLASEREQRLPDALIIVAVSLLVFLVIGVLSWRALLASLAGAGTYYLLYETLFFLVHRFQWSLSAFNTETNVRAFMNGRMIEAALSALIGVAVATVVYPLMRDHPKGPQNPAYLPGYLGLAPSTLLAILATLAMQVAWFLWQWGATVTWILPDLKWGFKYDLDLVQMTAVGAAVLVAPLVAYLVGRYHPKVRNQGG